MSFRPLFGSLLVGFVLAFCGSAEALGQSAGLDRSIISASGALNDGQKTSVSSFVARHAEAIRTGGDARSVEESPNLRPWPREATSTAP